jgi:hypothetical protein
MVANEPLRPDPENPRYLRFRGEPVVLITSAEHYGSVHNLDFDYVTYLSTLQRHRFNYTRAASGTFVERESTIEGAGWDNPHAPRPGRLVAPWRRSPVPGYAHGGNRFDLREIEPAYLARLHDFVAQAGLRGVIVEFTYFTAMFSDSQWGISPMNGRNNVNGIPPLSWDEVYRLDNGGLLEHQLELTRRLTAELLEHDNVMIEIFNEPYFGNVEQAWAERIGSAIEDVFAAADRRIPVSWNVANRSAPVTDAPSVANVFTFHYATPDAVRENAGIAAPLIDDETGYAGTADRPYRQEAWRFLLSGGAGFNHLDYGYGPGNERGSRRLPEYASGGGSESLREQLTFLRDLVVSVPFPRLAPQDVRVTVGDGGAQGLGMPGLGHLWYVTAEAPATVELEVGAGDYLLDWFDPVDRVVLAHTDLTVAEAGPVTLAVPGSAREAVGRLLPREDGAAIQTFDFAAAAREG